MQVNLNAIEPNYDTEIVKLLEAKGIPGCFGNMVLPFLEATIDIALEENFKSEQDITIEDKADVDMKKVVCENNLTGTYLTTKGLEHLQEYKEDRIFKYSDQAIKCFECVHTSKCYLLTQNYLKGAELHNK